MLRDDGERFLPWMADPIISYEHLHRYRMAAELAVGRRALDMASGEGYGAALLASTARSVLGVDLDPLAAAHAQMAYGSPRVAFVQGSIDAVPARSRQFGLVVCFEALEHVVEQDDLCREAARLLAPGGLFLVSTPNRLVYSEAADYRNPFHVKELDRGEFSALLARHFPHVRLFGQHVYPISSVFPLEEPSDGAREFCVARAAEGSPFGWVGPEAKAPRYFIGVASHSGLPGELGLSSVLVDVSEQLFVLHRKAEGAVQELTRHLKRREEQVLGLDRELARQAARLAGQAAQMTDLRAHLDARAAQAIELDALLRERGSQAQALAERVLELEGLLREQTARAARTAELQAQIVAMEATRAWRLRVKMRKILGRLPGGGGPAN